MSLDGKDAPPDEAREGEEKDADGVISDKVLAVKDSNDQLSGDETTPQVPEAPQPQYPKPTPPIPQTATHTPKVIPTVVTAKSEGTREESNPTKPPKKKSYDER